MSLVGLSAPSDGNESWPGSLEDFTFISSNAPYTDCVREAREKSTRRSEPITGHCMDSSRISRSRRLFSETAWYQKLPWSVMKKRERGSPSGMRKFDSNDADGTTKSRFTDTKRTSWMFIQTKPTEVGKSSRNKFHNDPLFESRSGIESRSRQRQIEKQQVFTMTPTSNPVPRPGSPNQNDPNKENTLGQLLFLKNDFNQRRNALSKSAEPDITRVPGPSDGNIYTKMKKKKSREAINQSVLPMSKKTSRVTLSSDIDAASQNAEDEDQNPKGPTLIAKKGVIHVDIKTGDVKLVVSSSIDEVDISHKTKENSNKQNKRLSLNSSNLHVVGEQSGEADKEEKIAISSLLADNRSNVLVQRSNENPDVEKKNYRNNLNAIHITEKDEKHSFFDDELASGILILKPEIEIDDNTAEPTESHLLQNSKDIDMLSRQNSYLTKQQVHDAMLLINECLSDQELRNENLFSVSPYDTFASNLDPNHNAPVTFQYSLQRQKNEATHDDNDEDDNLDFSWCDKILDGVIAELTSTGHQLAQNGNKESGSRYSKIRNQGSAYDQEIFSPNPFERLQETASYSDVDSGIDGSAMTVPVLSSFKGNNNGNENSVLKPNFLSEKINKSSEKSVNSDLNEKRVQDEIEKTKKYLAQLQERQIELEKFRDDRKRHSLMGMLPETDLSTDQQAMFYATLPKSPQGSFKVSETKNRKTPVDVLRKEKQDLSDLEPTNAMTTAFQVEQSQQHSYFGKTSPGFGTPDPASAKRADIFTPAYAHPMHQPQRMITAKNIYSRRLEMEPNKEEKPIEKEVVLKSHQEKNCLHSVDSVSENNKLTEKTKKPSNTDKSDQKKNQRKVLNDRVSNKESERSDDLQLQLEELDTFIAELSQTFTSTAPKASMLKRSASCANAKRERPKRVAFPPQSSSFKIKTSDSVPYPPSRSKSSYDSVSRRLFPSGSAERDCKTKSPAVGSGIQSPIKDDDVFTSQGVAQSSFPSQMGHIRPVQQQVSPATHVYKLSSPPKRQNKFEEQLSPQLFIAMSMNPGGRPVEEIHSYKEDLDPSFGMDPVDSISPVTPGFPVSPKTPYVNEKSPVSSHFPVGSVRTPLSILGLEHKPQPESVGVDIESESHPTLKNFPAQQATRSMPNRDCQSDGLQAGAHQGNGRNQSTRSLSGQKESQSNSVIQELRRTGYPSDSKPNLLSNNSHDSGYADSHPVHLASNGCNFSDPTPAKTSPPRLSQSGQPEQFRNPTSLPNTHHRSSFGEGGASSGASRSFSGSNDSLLSNSSSSGQRYRSVQSKNFSRPALPPKESSFRNSGKNYRTPSSETDSLEKVLQDFQTSTESAMLDSTINHHSSPSYAPLQRSESQMSSYERQGVHYPLHYNLSSDDSLSARTSNSSTAEIDRIANDLASIATPTTKFIKDTTSFWYKPELTREQALAMLRDRSPGCFVVRDSRCYPGAFGLALKVQRVPESVLKSAKPGIDLNDELVRHYLIEPSSRGVKLKGCANEPVFGSLSALIYQHSITPLALPCKLVIPLQNQEVPLENGAGSTPQDITNTAAELLRQGAACNVVYLGSIETESLTGPEAVERSISECFQDGESTIKTSVVHFKVSMQGITLTDNARKIFFRRHYPTATVTFCGMSPNSRRWNASADRGPPNARIFGFVAKKSISSLENVCHLFAELDLDQPAQAIVNFVTKILIGSG